MRPLRLLQPAAHSVSQKEREGFDGRICNRSLIQCFFFPSSPPSPHRSLSSLPPFLLPSPSLPPPPPLPSPPHHHLPPCRPPAMENSSVASASSEAGSTRSQEIEELERFIDSYVLEYQVQGLLGDKTDGELELDNSGKVPQVGI